MKMYKLLTNEGIIEVKGYPVIIEGFEEYNFFVHHPVWGGRSWKVSEVSTGMSVTPSPWRGNQKMTRDGAVALATDYLKYCGKDWLKRAIERVNKNL